MQMPETIKIPEIVRGAGILTKLYDTTRTVVGFCDEDVGYVRSVTDTPTEGTRYFSENTLLLLCKSNRLPLTQ